MRVVIIRKSPLYVLVSALLILAVALSNPPYTAYPTIVENGTSRNVIMVNQSGTGDYTHIQWAIDNASDGDTVFIEPGRYFENIIINKSIDIIGSGMQSTIIDGGGFGDVVHISTDHVILCDLSITNSGQSEWDHDCGIELYQTGNAVINSVNISDNRFGMSVFQSNDNIINNSISYNNLYGCLVVESNFNTISNNRIHQNKLDGIDISDSNNNTFSNNSIFNNRNGIDLERSLDHLIKDNTIENNEYDGITIYIRSIRNTIINNIIRNNNKNGIRFSSNSNHNIAAHNYIKSNDCRGIDIVNSCNNNFTGNRLELNGVSIIGSSLKYWNTHSIDTSNTVNSRPIYYYKNRDNTVLPREAGQAILVDCSNVVIEDQDLCAGFSIGFSDNITLSNNTISNEGNSLVLSEDNSISNNHFKDGSSLYLWECYRDTIVNNKFSIASIRLSSCINITIINNTLTNGGVSFSEGGQGQQNQQGQAQGAHGTLYLGEYIWSHTIDNNIMNGKPYFYYSFKSNFTVPQDAGWVIITKCSDFQINGFEEQSPIHISYSRRGVVVNCKYFQMKGLVYYYWHSSIIRVDLSEDIEIRNITFEECTSSIHVLDNNHILIENVNILNCDDGINSLGNTNCRILNNSIINSSGIEVYVDYNGRVENNTCENNSGPGIGIGTYNNIQEHSYIVRNNRCTNNSYGIFIEAHWVNIDDLFCEDNQCSFNEFDGIRIMNDDSMIRRNLCNFNGGDGISIPWGRENIITRNTCESNRNFAIYIPKYSYDYLIHHNNLIGNNRGGIQAFDNGSGNDWNHSGEGNYWADYTSRYPDANENGIVWNTPYEIDGIEAPKDHFPLCEPINIDYIAPVAMASGNLTTSQHQSFHFDARGSYGYPAIVNYTWSFYYNSTDYSLFGTRPIFIFHDIGTYPVTLTTSNERDDTATAVMTVTVVDGEPPTAIAGDNRTATVGELVNLDGSSSHDNIGVLNYTWSLIYNNTGVLLFGQETGFRFEIPGHYSFTLRVTDAVGLWGEDTLWIDVLSTDRPEDNGTFPGGDGNDTLDNNTPVDEKNPLENIPPVADAGDNVTTDQNTPVQLNGSGSRDDVGIVNYTWQFIYDGSLIRLYGPKPFFVFSIPGNYTITLRVMDIHGRFDEGFVFVYVEQSDEMDGNIEDLDPDKLVDDDLPDHESNSDEEGEILSSIWTWILLGMFILSIGGVFLYFLRKQKENEGGETRGDEYGRVGKEEDDGIPREGE